ncbi:MAG: hypothetical protein ACM3NQ_17895 [Bacteroidales bacterium]
MRRAPRSRRYAGGGLRRGERLETHGTPWPLLDGVVQALTASGTMDVTGAGQFAIATTGTSAWVPGSVVPFQERVLATVDRHGRFSRLAGRLNGILVDARSYGGVVRLAPHGGGQLAVTIRGLDEVTLWTVDLARGTLSRVTSDGDVYAPSWTPMRERAAFSWLRDGRNSLAWQRPYEPGEPDLLMDLDEHLPSSWTPTAAILPWPVTRAGRDDRHG